MDARVSNESLLEAGLTLMQEAGRPLERLPTNSRAMKFSLSNGETVRVRTCNDHVLVVLADRAEQGASLNIEGTDYLLIVMPEVPRTVGPVRAYFLPTSVAVEAARRTHAEWLASQPSTRGNNRTWNLWFSDEVAKGGGFGRIWSQYRLPGRASTAATRSAADARVPGEGRSLGAVIAEARKSIAEAAGVPIDAVKITVALD
jgi:hypothetical protein